MNQEITHTHAAEYGPLVETVLRVAPDQNADGIEAERTFVRQVHATYPEFRITTDERAYGPAVACVEWTATGTDSGEGRSGKWVFVKGATKFLFGNGRITQEIVRMETRRGAHLQ